MTTHATGTREDRLAVGARVAADWLPLAAAPIFAVMALLTGIHGAGAPDALCAHDASALGGMAAMYLLMSIFHLAPWLNLIIGRRNEASGIAPHLSLSRRAARH